MSEFKTPSNLIKAFNIDRKDFNDLFKILYPNLKAYACLMVDQSTAEDVVQEVFMYVWEHKDHIDIHTSVKAYLFKATYTRCLNYMNRHKMMYDKQKNIEMELKEYEKRFYDPDANEIIRTLYMNELREEMNNAIESLPEKCREVFSLSYLQDKKNKEISELLNISVSTVEKHINHALKVLRQALIHQLSLFLLSFFI